MEHVTDPDETHVAEEKLSPLLPVSSDPESDLEMTIPFALNERKASNAGSPPMQKLPSTASQSQDPFTQVKRTPYVNGRLQDQLPQKFGASSSPLKSNYNSLTNGNTNDDTEFVSASITSGPETSTAENHGEDGNTLTFRDQSTEEFAVRFAQESKSQGMTDSIAEKPNQLVAGVEQEKRRVDSVVEKSIDSPLVVKKNQCQSSGLNLSVLIAKVNVNNPAAPEELSTERGNHVDYPSQIPIVHGAHEMKRKVGDPSFVSPSATKRQKRFKPPSAFTLMERSETLRDPSEGARQYRQDFLASRRSSESSTPTRSPIMPFSIFPRITPESLRDPSERARQIRQEFLASRRSSENSTPTKSPSKPFTALTGIFPAEYRDSEAGKNAEHANVQEQSADADIRHQKTTKQNRLSPESQTRGINLNATPPLNGIAETEPDAGDGKLGAQSNPFCNHEVDSPSFAGKDAQHVDVEGRDAEQRTVIEASSCALNNEKQQTQSVELDVSVWSPDHRETEDRVANAEDGAVQTIELEEDMQVAHYDRVVNGDEEGLTVNSEQGKAPQDSIAQVADIVELESNVPARNPVLDDVAEPHTVAPKFIIQQHAIETLDTLISCERASEPTPRQTPIAMDADAPLPDELAKEATSHQERVGEYTDSPIPDLQVFQGTTSLNPIAYTHECANQTRPLSHAILAFDADTNTENQPHLSPTALDPANLLSHPRSDSEVESVASRHALMHPPSEISETKNIFLSQSLFDTFRVAYPAYSGDLKHFTAICRKISQLAKANRMEHQSLWDDFIVRHKIEYSQYLRRCAEEAEDAVPFEIFYQTEIEGPQHLKRVINRRNIDEVLALVVEQPNPEPTHSESIKKNERRAEPVDKSTFKSGLVIEETGHRKAPPNKDPLRPEENRSAAKPVASDSKSQKPSESRVLIDLTEDDPPDDLSKKMRRREIPSQSTLSPLVNGVSIGLSSLQSRRDSSDTLYPIHSPILPTTTPIKSTARSLRRKLPWEGPNHSVVQGSPSATASDSSRRLAGSPLRVIRAKGSSNAGEAHLEVPAAPTSNGPKQSQEHFKTCQRVIQSNWGIKAHELLDPEYTHGQAWSSSLIELLAEIASKISVGEARNRIKEAIDTRIGNDARREVGHLSQDRKLLKSDLEVVRGVVVSSSMSTTGPFPPPPTNAAKEKKKEDTSAQWWEDDDSPFKSFARAYASIRPGKGNSFATPSPAESGDNQKKDEATRSGVQLKKINIMRWTL